MKWPSRSAPLERNTASVRSAMTRRAPSWRGRRRVVMAARFYPRAADRPSVAVGDADIVSARPSLEDAPELDVDRLLLLARADPEVGVAVGPPGIRCVAGPHAPRPPRLGCPALRER